MKAGPLTYRDFWHCRGRQSFWLTLHCGYRLGAVLALGAYRMGWSPARLTLLSFLSGLAGVLMVAFGGFSPGVDGVLLFGFLHLAYGLDCADGVLARATGRTSQAGFLMDKCADLAGSLVVPGVLGIAAFGKACGPLSAAWHPFLLWWSLSPRVLLTGLIWMKDSLSPQINRRTEEDQRDQSFFLRVRRLAGNVIDDITYRTGIAASWTLGLYWEFMLAFQSVCFLFLVIYAMNSFRELRQRQS
jgi:hypothetical protein